MYGKYRLNPNWIEIVLFIEHKDEPDDDSCEKLMLNITLPEATFFFLKRNIVEQRNMGVNNLKSYATWLFSGALPYALILQ